MWTRIAAGMRRVSRADVFRLPRQHRYFTPTGNPRVSRCAGFAILTHRFEGGSALKRSLPVRALLTLFALLPLPAVAHMPVERPSPRRTTVRDVSLHVTRTVLPNGMIVLLSPDAGSASVVVDVTFRA